MKLHLLRHGIAEPGGLGSDSERRLTSEGVQKARQVASGIARLGVRFDLILSSPLVRARQTAEILAEETACGDRLELTDALIYTNPFEKLVAELNSRRPQPESVALVGHEPHLGQLMSVLVTGEACGAFTMTKAGFARLTVDHLLAGRCARLDWLIPPRLFLAD